MVLEILDSKFEDNTHMQYLSRQHIIPKIVHSTSGKVVMRHIKGRRLCKILSDKKTDETVLKKIFSELGTMVAEVDKCHMRHGDLHTGDVIVEHSTNKPYIIDWEFATYSEFSQVDAMDLLSNAEYDLNSCARQELYKELETIYKKSYMDSIRAGASEEVLKLREIAGKKF